MTRQPASRREWAKLTLSGAMATLFLACGMVCAAGEPAVRPPGWQADPKLLEELHKKNARGEYNEAAVPAYRLPDPLVCEDGSRVTTRQQWEQKRRDETLELFRRTVYGRRPERTGEMRFDVLAKDEKAMEGKATLKRVKITCTDGGRSFAFEASLLIPNGATGRVPAFVLINNREVKSADPTRQTKDPFWSAEEIIARGYAAAVFQTNDVDPDKPDEASRAKGVRGALTSAGKAGEDAWGTIAAWAWGASRIMDYLATDANIDASKVAIIGHSRGGKTALWAGAEDSRFSLVISNDSGCGGASLSRRHFGETIEIINRSFPHWFCGNFKQYGGHENDRPVDQHQLMALIAPQAVYVASADADFWADQRGEFLSLANASPVYALYGYTGLKLDEMPPLETPTIRDRMAYHIRRGGHGLTLYDWQQYLNFADRLWRTERP